MLAHTQNLKTHGNSRCYNYDKHVVVDKTSIMLKQVITCIETNERNKFSGTTYSLQVMDIYVEVEISFAEKQYPQHCQQANLLEKLQR